MSLMSTAYNRIVWVDIPVTDLNRAVDFYRAVLNCEIDTQEQDGKMIGVFRPSGGNAASLIPASNEIISTEGLLVYMNVEGRIRDAVKQVEMKGGKVTQRIHTIAPYGFRAIILDSEGNRIALHSGMDA
jgi:predicted enzyme related to lactoylglutathione lyase